MSAPARLLALRLHGFKSFAERTNVEFGPGISAVVGPNGSGKSNLADALRWALGEQGRALRSRKSEDVIWAGSDRRAAQGMADVTLVVDNADGLIPVEYQVLELGRRLYRSGENDYLLNKQRIRLRDLVDLLDSAHLADNAFLFIGQGMVDQALALRPEERRPLFEEVAGVRRHDRRRRRAEEQLAESEANLARAQDILGELRPQVRRLAAQAEQQTSRRSAGEELADALVTAAHARWHEAATRLARAGQDRDAAQAAFDAILEAQEAAEREAATIGTALEARAAREREIAARHELARSSLIELQLRDARFAAEEAALERDHARLVEERQAAEADLIVARRGLSVPEAPRDRELEAALAEADRALGETLAQLADLRASRRAHGEELEALRRAEAIRRAEEETARRRHADAARRLADEAERSAALEARRIELAGAAADLVAAIAVAAEAALRAEAARDAARAEVETLDAERRATAERLASAGQALGAARGQLEALERRIAADAERGIARAARRRGGRQVDADLLIDASLRGAVELALADRRRAYVVGRRAVAELAGENGALVVEERLATKVTADDARERRFRDRVVSLGGGSLGDSVRRDASGAIRRLLHRAVWLPDLEACLELQPDLPPGWVVVTRDGTAAVTELTVSLGTPEGALDRQADVSRLSAEVTSLEAADAALRAALHELDERLRIARETLATATSQERALAVRRRETEERERRAVRDAEAALREATWHEAQVARLTTEVERLAAALPATVTTEPPADDQSSDADPTASALETWETRAADLRLRRDTLAAEVADQDRAVRTGHDARARAEATVAGAQARIGRADEETARAAERIRTLAVERETIGDALRDAIPREEQARRELEAIRAEDQGDRRRLALAEAAVSATRDRVRAAEDRSRAADRIDLEARLALENLREQLLVELAGLGGDGIARLRSEAGAAAADAVSSKAPPRGVMAVALDRGTSKTNGAADAPDDGDGSDTADATDTADPDVVALEGALEAVAHGWAHAAPSGDVPSAGRLASLRRRYHELGAVNPFAVAEYDELRARLADLEAQESDLRSAIVSTRELVAELNALIATQFRATFESLESAFDVRFQQLFGGGYAKLALTDPGDLSATGVEIVARPPGKKAQALAMLSGGERALTAVALLFAMLTVRPVPFCVLDEVDAALDEANVGRFADVLRELSARTQFIVITHNRGTIEKADALYGVTVGDDSVSRVISLRLDEAQAIAARASNGTDAAIEPAGTLVG